MTTHPNTQTQHHENSANAGDDHDIAPPAAHPDARDDPLVDVDREEIVPLGRRSPRPQPQTPPRKPWQPRALIATTLAAFVGLTITIVALLALFDASKPRRDSTVSPTIALSSDDTVAQPTVQRARRMAARQHASDRHVAKRNRRALAQRRRLATRNARARAAAWRRPQAINRRSTPTRWTPTRARSHALPPPARPACGEFDLC